MVAHVYNPNPWQARSEGLKIPDQPGLLGETVAKTRQRRKGRR